MASVARREQEMRQARILLVMGVGLSHEIVHCLRLLVSSDSQSRLTRSFETTCARTA